MKCAHLVPKSGSRWRSHVVLGSKKKNPRRNFDAETHHQMHHDDVVPELAGRRSMSLLARSKKLKLFSPIYM